MKRSTTSILFFGLFALLLAWTPAHAAKQVATVVAARGEVQAVDAKGKSRPLAVQAPILEEDTVKTGAHSRVQIMFTDNTLINLGNETTMKIAEYRWQPEQKDGALKTQVKEGTFRVMGGALTKTAPQNFKTETPTATIGIRGSMYAGVATADFLSVVFQGGKGIEVTNAFGTVEISKPGYGTKVTLDKPPLPPLKFTSKEMGDMNKALSGNGNGEKEEKKEEKKEKSEDKGKKEDKSQEKAPAPKEGQTTAQPPAEKQPASTAPAPADTAPLVSWETTPIDPVKETTPPVPPATLTPPLIPPVPIDLVKDVVTDNSQKKKLVTEVTTKAAEAVATAAIDTAAIDTAAPPPAIDTPAASTTLSGNQRFFLRDIDLTLANPSQFDSTFLAYSAGTAAATLLGTGELSGTLSNGTSFGPYQIPGYDPNATSYPGSSTITDTTIFFDTTIFADLLTQGSFNLSVSTFVEPTGQFFYNIFYAGIDSNPDFLLGQLLYAGDPSSTIPATGIDKFTGHLIYSSPTVLDADMEETSIAVNYYNKRLIGRSFEMNPAVTTTNNGAVFFGTVNNTGTADLTILAGGAPNGGGGGDVTAAYGTATATLYGSFNQGLGFTASGADYSVITNAQTNTWQATGAALRAAGTGVSPTTAATYRGFVVGVADNTATGAVSRIFMNDTPDDFTLSPNAITGVVSGTITNTTELLGGAALTGLTIGGTAGTSAYVQNDDMAAILSGSNLALSTYGNFLYTAGPNAPSITNTPNDFMTWGYWEMAYTDPNDPTGSQSNDHLFSSQSFFVTGQQTDPAYITANFLNPEITGTYDGKAFGVQLDSNGQNATQLTNGTTHLVLDFANPALANAVTGTISFDQASLAINSAASTLNNAGFTAFVSSVSGTAPSSSAVNGAFYGPAAEAVGGNFHAQMGTGVRYLGVFGGSLLPVNPLGNNATAP